MRRRPRPKEMAMSTAASPMRFQAALMRSGPLFRDTAVNLAALRRDTGDAVRLAVSLHGYQRYVQQARAFKARTGAPAAQVEREVLDHGRQAAADGRMLAASFLKTV